MNLRSILRRSAGLERGQTFSIGDPALADFLGMGGRSSAGQNVTEESAYALTAWWRGVSLIAGTLAGLPWKTYREAPDGTRERAESWIDDPGAVAGLTPYAWKELLYVHLLTWGNFYGEDVRAGGGQSMGLRPWHPSRVQVVLDSDNGQKVFRCTDAAGKRKEFSPVTMLHIAGLSTDGLRGLVPLSVARNAIGSGLAGDEAAARMFEHGAMIAGLVTSDQTVKPEEAAGIVANLNARLSGTQNAGRWAFVNRDLKFTPWGQTLEDAQFIEQRAHQVEEVARFLGLPKVLLAADGASTWGSGIAELVRGLQKFTFRPLAARVEDALSTRLEPAEFLEIDFAGLLAPTEEEATQNMLAEVSAGTMSIDEFRRIKNRPPLERVPDAGVTG